MMHGTGESFRVSRYAQIMMRRNTKRRYPNRFLGRRLEAAVRQYEKGHGIFKQEAVALEIGVGAQKLSQWISGHSHPTEEAIGAMALLGLAWLELEELMWIDKLDAWRGGADVDDIIKTARAIKSAEAAQKGARAAVR